MKWNFNTLMQLQKKLFLNMQMKLNPFTTWSTTRNKSPQKAKIHKNLKTMTLHLKKESHFPHLSMLTCLKKSFTLSFISRYNSLWEKISSTSPSTFTTIVLTDNIYILIFQNSPIHYIKLYQISFYEKMDGFIPIWSPMFA